jgi:ABC-type transport system involved in cytochrome c biogenesis ATPase subunit
MKSGMLTRLQVRNFKRLANLDIELGKTVVFIGPNNSGKTTALQALALWDAGLKLWLGKHGSHKNGVGRSKRVPVERPGVTINRRDLIAIPIPDANLLWRDLHVRNIKREGANGKSQQQTENIRIDILVEGITAGKTWTCGLEFDYANQESFYCRPLRAGPGEGKHIPRMEIPEEAENVQVAFLPPMSGLAAVEPKWEPGRINVLIGEGQTAQVLRNLCFQIYALGDGQHIWQKLVTNIKKLFGVTLLPPQHISTRGEIVMNYAERHGIELDLSSSGRGLQQTFLLLAHLYANPGAILLLDEPDAHLEILRQREIYQLLTAVATTQGSQIIAASHSEVLLNEAAGRDMVIAFVGTPHRIDDRGSQVVKALREIGFDHYYQAEQTGWVLYLEGSTDLAILRSFAEILEHPASAYLERAFVVYVGNVVNDVRKHFGGLREAKPDLVGIAIFDHLERPLPGDLTIPCLQWQRREIENYLCRPEVLRAYAQYQMLPNDLFHPDDLFGFAEAERRLQIMNEVIEQVSQALQTFRGRDPWSPDTKATDEFLDPLFRNYFNKLEMPNLLTKSNYHMLAGLLTKEQIPPEVSEKLDAIVTVAQRAQPRQD